MRTSGPIISSQDAKINTREFDRARRRLVWLVWLVKIIMGIFLQANLWALKQIAVLLAYVEPAWRQRVTWGILGLRVRKLTSAPCLRNFSVGSGIGRRARMSPDWMKRWGILLIMTRLELVRSNINLSKAPNSSSWWFKVCYRSYNKHILSFHINRP